jgi:hypothetical protein
MVMMGSGVLAKRRSCPAGAAKARACILFGRVI